MPDDVSTALNAAAVGSPQSRPFRDSGNPGSAFRGEMSPELIRRVADRVYAMLLDELRIERERYREGSLTNAVPGGVKWI